MPVPERVERERRFGHFAMGSTDSSKIVKCLCRSEWKGSEGSGIEHITPVGREKLITDGLINKERLV